MNVKLFEPYEIKGVRLKNRIVMSPMCMYSCSKEDGMITDWHYTHYISRAVGQAGLIIVEATAVTPEGRISPKDLGIWQDKHIPGLKKLTKMIKEQGTVAGIQISHAGRKAELDSEIVAPSAIPFQSDMKTPREMTLEEISHTKEAFRQAAERAKKAGFDVLEIHAAHGYLLNEFLSPLTNKRQDAYGGTLENRYRFVKEVIEEVKVVWTGPLFVRISANEYHEEGLTIDDYLLISQWIKEQGVDLIDVSTGGVVPAPVTAFPGYQVPYAQKIKEHVTIPTGAVGLITSAIQAEEILQNGRADLIFLARTLLRDPYWPRTAAKELGVDIIAPNQYQRGWL